MLRETSFAKADDVDRLLEAIGLDEERVLARLAFLEFGEHDARLLAPLRGKLQTFLDSFGRLFYAYLKALPVLHHSFRTPEAIEGLQDSQVACFSSSLFQKRYDKQFVRSRIAAALAHQNIGLPAEWYLGAYRKYLSELLPGLWELSEHDFNRFERTFDSLLKIVFFDIGIALDAYSAADNRLIAQKPVLADPAIHAVASVANASGQAFLLQLAAELSKTLGMRYAMVAEVPGDAFKDSFSLVLTDRGWPLTSLQCRLAGTPWEAIVEQGMHVYPDKVQELFPEDAALKRLDVQSCAGMPLHDRAGRVIGILAMLDDVPIQNDAPIRQLLPLFALCATAEIGRLHAEQSLAESELRFRTVFNQAAVGFVHLRPDGRFLRANDKFCDIFGCHKADIIGQHFSAVIHSEYLQESNKIINGIIANPRRVIRGEKRRLRPDGSVALLRFTSSGVVDDTGTLQYLALVVEDITSAKHLSHMLHLSNRALESVNSGIVIFEAQREQYPIVFANPAFCRMASCLQDQMLGTDLFALQDVNSHSAAVHAAIAGQDGGQVVLSRTNQDGSTRWMQLSISPVPDKRGKTTHFIGIQTDITEQKQYEERLAFKATHDELTGLSNRYQLQLELRDMLQRANAGPTTAALLFLDVDNFKLVNESIDHVTGDLLIKFLAERLARQISPGDFLARHSGAGFAIVLSQVVEEKDVDRFCEKLLQTVSEPFLIDGQSIHVTCSIGVALYPRDGGDETTLFKFADMALYRAKEMGRNTTQFFSREMNERTLERVALESALHTAIHSNQLRVHYQPLVDLLSGRIVGLEALARWEHPELGLVSPVRFIPIAEESGLISGIGEWVLRRTCQDMRTWVDEGHADLRVAVNVSPKQFRDPLLANKISSAVAEAGIPPSAICLEITETVLMQDTPASESTLQQLKALGIDLVLDDFGTGYSSLSYLKRFPFDKVKIDRSFITEIVSDKDDAAIARAIISMSHSLGIRVVAEGVETEGQCEFLRRHVCDEIQGFLFSAAVPPEQISEMLREGRCLPEHLLRLQRPSRTLLLVDDEINIVAALKRLLRRDGYRILTANSGQEGLNVLVQEDVDVIISDQRMPGMTGTEFLGIAKDLYPDTVRIVLSGYTELQSVTDAVNQGAIYKFLTKPWDDEQLRGHVEEAFRRKEMEDENRRLNLEVSTANQELAAANRQLEEVLRQKQQQIVRDEISLQVVREVLQNIPLPVIGLDDDGLIAFVNDAAEALFEGAGPLLGADAKLLMPELFDAISREEEGEGCVTELNGTLFNVVAHVMGKGSRSRGTLMTLTRCEVSR